MNMEYAQTSVAEGCRKVGKGRGEKHEANATVCKGRGVEEGGGGKEGGGSNKLLLICSWVCVCMDQ